MGLIDKNSTSISQDNRQEIVNTSTADNKVGSVAGSSAASGGILTINAPTQELVDSQRDFLGTAQRLVEAVLSTSDEAIASARLGQEASLAQASQAVDALSTQRARETEPGAVTTEKALILGAGVLVLFGIGWMVTQ